MCAIMTMILALTPASLAAQPAANRPASTRPAATQPARRVADTQPARRTPATRPADLGFILPAPNPHWTKTGCGYCHKMDGNRALPIPVADVQGICMDCHDGRRASEEPHPVGLTFTRAIRPEGWPAPDGKVTCITCHDVHPRGRPDGPRPADNPMFLREWGGDLLTYCGKCHPSEREPEVRYNPHLIQVQNGQVVGQSCVFCHTKAMPAGEGAARTGEAHLRGSPNSLCVGCHPTHIDWFEPGHIGTRVTPEVLAALRSFAAQHGAGPAAQPGAEYLPLDGGDTVVCSTCHNPHQTGVFPAGSVLAAGAIRPGQPAEQLRGLGKNLCGACHGE